MRTKQRTIETMTFKEVLQRFRTGSFTEREKGAKFEKLMKRWFQTDPRYADKLQEVWLWEEFPGKKDFGGKDLGIDLVAKTDIGPSSVNAMTRRPS